MVVSTTPPTQSPLRDLHFMANPSLWVIWPFLPLVRRRPEGQIDYGVLFDSQGVCNITGYCCAVFLSNLFALPSRLDQFFALPKEVYDSFDEVVAAGWRVD